MIVANKSATTEATDEYLFPPREGHKQIVLGFEFKLKWHCVDKVAAMYVVNIECNRIFQYITRFSDSH